MITLSYYMHVCKLEFWNLSSFTLIHFLYLSFVLNIYNKFSGLKKLSAWSRYVYMLDIT